MVRTLLVGAAVMFAASSAGAQITTYVAPPRPESESPALIAAADSARRDSVARQTAENMRAWVDSAAGVSVPASVGDTVNDPGRPITSFADGSVAPATASELPTLLLLGLVSFLTGLGLLTNRPRG
jgi:hypothetical protein